MKKITITIIILSILIILTSCGVSSPAITIFVDSNAVEDLEMFVGEELQLECNVANVVWSSNNPQGVIVEEDGYTRAKAVGQYVLTASKEDAKKEITINVVEYIPMESIEDYTADYVIKRGNKKKLKYGVSPENCSDKRIEYTITNYDGNITIENGYIAISEEAIPSFEYQVRGENLRSGVSFEFTVTVSSVVDKIAWTIGDSIFDFRDNSKNDMVPTILINEGFKFENLYFDNIAGSTIKAASGVGIAEHIDNGMYSAWPEPDLIIIQRGTNDAFFNNTQPTFFTDKSVEEDIKKTCEFISQNYENARVIWSTSIYRADVPQDKLTWINGLIKKYTQEYGFECFDLNATEEFGGLNQENYFTLLYDGIHLNDTGVEKMISAFDKYFNN